MRACPLSLSFGIVDVNYGCHQEGGGDDLQLSQYLEATLRCLDEEPVELRGGRTLAQVDVALHIRSEHLSAPEIDPSLAAHDVGILRCVDRNAYGFEKVPVKIELAWLDGRIAETISRVEFVRFGVNFRSKRHYEGHGHRRFLEPGTSWALSSAYASVRRSFKGV